MQKEHLRLLTDGLTPDELRTLRAIINGKLSKRTLTPEQQTKMQRQRPATLREWPMPNGHQVITVIRKKGRYHLVLTENECFGFGGVVSNITEEKALQLAAMPLPEFIEAYREIFEADTKTRSIPCPREKAYKDKLRAERGLA